MAVIDGKWLSKEGLTHLWSKLKAILASVIDRGAKNTLNVSSFTSQTAYGITLTRNSDDSFTITGTFTAHQNAFFTISTVTGVAGTVMLMDGGERGLYAYARNGNSSSWATSSGGVSITAPIPSANVGDTFDIAIMLQNQNGDFDGRTFNKTVRVMICDASDYSISSAVKPYAPTNRELYEMILALQSGSTTQTVNSLQRMDLSRMEDADTENDTPETEDEISDLSEK